MQPMTHFREPGVLIRESQRKVSVAARMAGAIEYRNSCYLGWRGRIKGRIQHVGRR